jgi:hypothetical protein
MRTKVARGFQTGAMARAKVPRMLRPGSKLGASLFAQRARSNWARQPASTLNTANFFTPRTGTEFANVQPGGFEEGASFVFASETL